MRAAYWRDSDGRLAFGLGENASLHELFNWRKVDSQLGTTSTASDVVDADGIVVGLQR